MSPHVNFCNVHAYIYTLNDSDSKMHPHEITPHLPEHVCLSFSRYVLQQANSNDPIICSHQKSLIQ